MISKREINKKIKAAFWDYKVEPNEIYLKAIGRIKADSMFTKEKILVRLINRLSWYELVDIFGLDFLKSNLSPSIIKQIKNTDIRKRYESVRKILYGKSLSSSGWSAQNRKRLKSSILSNRRYSA